MRGVLVVSAFLLSGGSAFADRPVTGEEASRLAEAVAAAGCSGGKFEVDDGKFEVEKAACADGKTYELVFDSSFTLVEKKLED
jgi:hypothetical protein